MVLFESLVQQLVLLKDAQRVCAGKHEAAQSVQRIQRDEAQPDSREEHPRVDRMTHILVGASYDQLVIIMQRNAADPVLAQFALCGHTQGQTERYYSKAGHPDHHQVVERFADHREKAGHYQGLRERQV